MKVELIYCPPSETAVNILLMTKQTRLEMNAKAADDIASWPWEKKQAELLYMSKTIPSSWEFVDYIFRITGCSRAYTHQQVRTRAGSYAQQTMRVLDVSGFKWVTGPSIEENPALQQAYDHAMRMINEQYQWLIRNGAEVEDARGILPTNIQTNIICKFNLRTLAEICVSRKGIRTQNEYRQAVDGMFKVVTAAHPWSLPFLDPQGSDEIRLLEEFVKANGKDIKLVKALDILRKRLTAKEVAGE